MSDLPPITQKFGADTTQFKAALSELNRSIRVIESEFRATAATMDDWSSTSEGLEARQAALTKQIELQQRKVSALQSEYQRVAKEKGETSRAAQELQIKLNRETETLGKMQVELRQTDQRLEEVGSESKQTGKQIDDLGDKAEQTAKKSGGLGNALEGLGGIAKGAALAVAAVATAAAAAAAGIAGIAMGSINAAGELVDLSTKTGFSTTTLQELGYVGGQVGTDLETITGSLARLIRSMDDVGTNKEIAAAFQTLGVSATDANGNLRDSEVVFGEVIDALGAVANETERDALAMEIFGRSAMELNPLIKAGADEIAALTEEAHAMGAVMSEDAVYGLEAVGDTLAGLQAGLQGAAGTIAAALLPGLEGMAGTAQGYMSEFAGIIERSGGNLTRSGRGLGSLFGRIFADIGESAPGMLEAGLSVVQALINAIMTALPTMIPAAIAMITSLVTFILENLPLLMQAGIDIVMALINGIAPMLPRLVEAAVEMIVTLAQGLAEAIPQLLPVIATIIPQIIVALIENLPMLITAAIQLIMALVQGLISALPILIQQAPVIVQALVTAIVSNLPLIIDAALQLITALVDAIILNLPLLGEAALQILDALVTGIGDLLPMIGDAAGQLIGTLVRAVEGLAPVILEVGRGIVTGIWLGIQGQASWFGEQLKRFFTSIVDGVKKTLGISSPSKVFAGIGQNMAAGLGVGFEDAFRSIRRDVMSAVGDLGDVDLPGGVTGPRLAAAGAAAAPITINFQVTASSEFDFYKMARMVADEIHRRR